MPVKKQDAHRALELLEEYHGRLNNTEDKQLRMAIEKVIKIFKSRLFQALLDIQEFYEVTLLDENKTTDQKTVETIQVADRWTASPGLPAPASTGTGPGSGTGGRRHKSRRDSDEAMLPPAPPPMAMEPAHQPYSTNGMPPPPSEETPMAASADWKLFELVLNRGSSGFGFSIAGGVDAPHFSPDDPAIYVTKVVPGGAADLDGRMQLNDCILRVNEMDVSAVPHNTAVDSLKRAGGQLRLLIRRPVGGSAEGQPGQSYRVLLVKSGRGLGFSIAGGAGNEHIVGDPGIFITKVIEDGAAAVDGRIGVGDRLIAVNEHNLDGVTHEDAVEALKATGQQVELTLVKAGPAEVAAMTAAEEMAAAGVGGGSGSMPPPPEPMVESPESNTTGGLSEAMLPPALIVPENEDISREPRKLTLKKGGTGLGFNIVGGENGEGIFVSFILAGGPADLSGELLRGDQLLVVNGVDLVAATHEQAAAALKGAGDSVEIVAAYRPEEYNRFEARIQDLREQMINSGTGAAAGAGAIRTTQKRTLYVRALFEYDPSKDSGLPSKGLPFQYGDILHVTNASDDEWWQARRVTSSGDEEGLGIVPSKKRVERRERARLKRVNFNGKPAGPNVSTLPSGGQSTGGSTSGGSGGGTLEKEKKKKGLFSKLGKGSTKGSKDLASVEASDQNADDSASGGGASSAGQDAILSYEVVQQIEIRFARPVIILGPLKDRLNDELITQYSERFGSCVPHTTRLPREHEVNGRDYHFVSSREQMERDIANHLFIEAGQYNGNLYGTSVESVRQVAESGKHCILDVSGNAIRRLQVASLYPIAIFIKPRSAEHIIELNRRVTEEQAKKAYERALKLEGDFYEFFTAVVSGESVEDVYSKVNNVISAQSGPNIWVAAKDQQL